MIQTDEQALICDLAETYQIYDYKSLPLEQVAIFSVGLRDDSRIKMKMAGEKAPADTLILASISDALSMVLWVLSGAEEKNKPPLLTSIISGKAAEQTETHPFNTPESFETMRKEILKKGGM